MSTQPPNIYFYQLNIDDNAVDIDLLEKGDNSQSPRNLLEQLLRRTSLVQSNIATLAIAALKIVTPSNKTRIFLGATQVDDFVRWTNTDTNTDDDNSATKQPSTYLPLSADLLNSLRNGQGLPSSITLKANCQTLLQQRVDLAAQNASDRTAFDLHLQFVALDDQEGLLNGTEFVLSYRIGFQGGYKIALSASLVEPGENAGRLYHLPAHMDAPVKLGTLQFQWDRHFRPKQQPSSQELAGVENRPIQLTLQPQIGNPKETKAKAALDDLDDNVIKTFVALLAEHIVLAEAEGDKSWSLPRLEAPTADLVSLLSPPDAPRADTADTHVQIYFDGIRPPQTDKDLRSVFILLAPDFFEKAQETATRALIDALPAQGLPIHLQACWPQPEGKLGCLSAAGNLAGFAPRPINQITLDVTVDGQRPQHAPTSNTRPTSIDFDTDFPHSGAVIPQEDRAIPIRFEISPNEMRANGQWLPSSIQISIGNHRNGSVSVKVCKLEGPKPFTLSGPSKEENENANFQIEPGNTVNIQLGFDQQFLEHGHGLHQLTYAFDMALELHDQNRQTGAHNLAEMGSPFVTQHTVSFSIVVKRKGATPVLGLDFGSGTLAAALLKPGSETPQLLPLTGKPSHPDEQLTATAEHLFLPALAGIGIAKGDLAQAAMRWQDLTHPLSKAIFDPFARTQTLFSGVDEKADIGAAHGPGALGRRYAVFLPPVLPKTLKKSSNAQNIDPQPEMHIVSLKSLLLGETPLGGKDCQVWDAQYPRISNAALDGADLLTDILHELLDFHLSLALRPIPAHDAPTETAEPSLPTNLRLALSVPSRLSEQAFDMIKRAGASMLARLERAGFHPPLNAGEDEIDFDKFAELLGWRTESARIEDVRLIPEGVAAAYGACAAYTRHRHEQAPEINQDTALPQHFWLLTADIGQTWTDYAVAEMENREESTLEITRILAHDSVRLGGSDIDFALAVDCVNLVKELRDETGFSHPHFDAIATAMQKACNQDRFPPDIDRDSPAAEFIRAVSQAKTSYQASSGGLLNIVLGTLPTERDNEHYKILAASNKQDRHEFRVLEYDDGKSAPVLIFAIPQNLLRDRDRHLLPLITLLGQVFPVSALVQAERHLGANVPPPPYLFYLSGRASLFPLLADAFHKASFMQPMPFPQAAASFGEQNIQAKAAAALGASLAASQDDIKDKHIWQAATAIYPLAPDFIDNGFQLFRKHMGSITEEYIHNISQESLGILQKLIARFWDTEQEQLYFRTDS